jgi:N-acetylmuramoyl-L-alanine amidase
VPLDQRVSFSLHHHADLFISIHADSVGASEYAGHVRGATVYTMSEKASDERARRLAEKENASDILAGFDVSNEEGNDHVRSILLDLMKRETANFSIDFRRILVKRLKRQVLLAREPQREAAFKVLRQTHAPSVLIELGYMSHAEDVQLLRSGDWQKRVAGAIGAAVDEYFSRSVPKYR